MKKNDEPIIVEQTFNASIDALWKAITEIGQMRRWYFENIPSFKPEAGFETQFNVRSQGRNFLHMWKVTEVVPQKMIKYNWKYKDYPGDSFVIWEIFKEGDLTKLKLTVQIEDSFPGDIPEFTRESCMEGWDFFIRKRLKEFLE